MCRFVEYESSGAIRHHHGAIGAVCVGKQRNRVGFRSDFDRPGGAAHLQRVHGGLDHHLFGIVGRDVAAGEREDAFHHREERFALLRVSVVVEVFEENAGAFIDGEHRAVVEDQGDVGIYTGLQFVTLVKRRLHRHLDHGAVGFGGGDLSLYRGDVSNRRGVDTEL